MSTTHKVSGAAVRDTPDHQEFYLARRAADVVYDLRNAVRSMDLLVSFITQSEVIQNGIRSRGLDPVKVAEFVAGLRKQAQHVKVNFELQMFGSSHDGADTGA